jgi:exonuclease III
MFYHNSPTSSRGVGILVSKNLNFIKNGEFKDRKGNLLLIKAQINSYEIVIGAIYGPNDNDANFFRDLEFGMDQLGCNKILVGGDWNATWDPRPAENNIDVINMASIPSRFRTEQIKRIAAKFGLTDPFRALHPIRREFTYIPNARINLNRSRIDFFLISENEIPHVTDASIIPALSSTSFDHKKILLSLGRPKVVKNYGKINDRVLKEEGIVLLVKTKILESYLIHTDPETIPRYVKFDLLIDIGRIESMVRQSLKVKYDKGELEMENNERISQELLDNARDIYETLPNHDFFLNLTLACDDDFFFEGLISIVRATTLSVQSDLFKYKNNQKTF